MSVSEFGNGFISLVENLGAGTEFLTLNVPSISTSFSLTLPNSVGLSNQVLSSGSTPGNLEWIVPPQKSWRQKVVSSSVGNVILSPAPSILDDVVLTTGDRVLLKDQSDITQNGIYTYNGTDFIRAPDASATEEASGTVIYVSGGSTNANKIYYVTDANSIEFDDGVTYEELDIIRVLLGPGSLLDNEIARFDGIEGNTIKGSSNFINDSGDMTLSVGNIELGVNDVILSSTTTQNITHTGSSGQNLVFSSGGKILVNQIEFENKAILFPETNGSIDRISLTAPSDVTSSYTLNLPVDLGSANQVLSTGLTPGTMQWVNQITGFPPNGPIGSVQFNDSFNFGGSANFLWENTTLALTLNATINGVTTIGMSGDFTNSAGDILLTNSNATNITHTGGSGNLIIGSTSSNVEIENVEFNNGAVSNASDIIMSGDFTNSAGDILFMNSNATNITHTGGSGNLVINSTSSNVEIETVEFNNGAVSNVSTVDMSGDFTNSAGDILLSSTSAQNITHTGGVGQNLTIGSGGNVTVDNVVINNGAISNATTVTGSGNFSSGGDFIFTNSNATNISHTGGSGDFSIVSTNNSVVIENVAFNNGNVTGMTSLGTTGNITSGGNVNLTNTGVSNITHTGGSGDLSITSGSNVEIENVSINGNTIDNVTDFSLSSDINFTNINDQTIFKGTQRIQMTSGSNINVQGVLFNDNDMINVGNFTMTGSITDSGSNIVFSETTSQNITHTGQIGQNLTITSGSNIIIDTTTFNNGEITTPGNIRSNNSLILEDPGAGLNIITLRAPTLGTSYSFNFPVDNGSVNQLLSTNGSGTLSWINDPNNPGGPNTAIQFNNSSVYGGTSDLAWDDTNKLLTLNGKYFSNFATSSGTPGLFGTNFDVQAQTYTDNSGGPTTTNAVFNSFGKPTLAASSATITTDAATVYIAGAPIAGTNETITNSYSLWSDNGFIGIENDLISNGNIDSTQTVIATQLTDGSVTITGGNISGVNTVTTTNMNIGTISDGTISLSSGLMTGIVTPTVDSAISNKLYADNNISGAKWKEVVRLCSDTNVTLSGEQTIDSVSAVTGDRVLLVGQTLPRQNGIWIVDSSAWSRSSDLAESDEATGVSTLVEEGTVYTSAGFVCTAISPNNVVGNDAGTTGDDLPFVQFTGAGLLEAGGAILKVGNTFSVKTDEVSVQIVSDAVQLKDDGITTNKFADNTISTNKIQDNSINNFKLANTTFTINPGDGLQNGGVVSLGASTSLSVNSSVLRTSGDQNASGIQSFTDTTGSISSVTGAVTVGGGMAVSENINLGGNFTTGTGITANSITDGTATLTGGNLTGIGSINSSTFTASGSITAGTLTDNTTTITGGTLIGVNNVTATGVLTGNVITDGSLTLTGGTLTGVSNPTTGDEVANKNYVDSLTVTAGDGLSQVTTVFNVNVDNTTIEINSDQLQVKNAGISTVKLNTDSVITSKIVDNSITNPKLQFSDFTINSGNGLQTPNVVNLGGSITLNLDNTVLRTTGNQIASGIQSFTNTLESTSSTNGSVVISGGLGITKNTFIGGNLETGVITSGTFSDGTLSLNSGNFTSLNTISTGSLTAAGIVQGGTITDGTLSMNTGSFSSIINITASGNISGGTFLDGTASMNSGTLTGLLAPTVDSDATNKLYVDSQTYGTNWIAPVRAATTGNITLSGTQTIDTISLTNGDRVLVKNQTSQVENGIYVVDSGSWSRAGDMSNGSAEEFAVYVKEGDNNIGTSWIVTESFPFLIGFSNLVWTKFTQGGDINAGQALLKTGSTFDVQVDDITIEVFSDQLRIKDNSIDNVKFLNDAVTTDKIVDNAVTNAKLTNDNFTITSGDGLQAGGTITLGNNVSVEIDNTVLRTTGNQSVSGIQNFTNITQSNSTNSGSALFSGGIGIDKNLYTGGNIISSSTVTSGVSLSDSTATITSGNITGGGVFNTGTLTVTGGSIQGGTLTDTAASLNAGSFTGINNLTLSGTMTLGSMSDGVATLSGGTLTGLVAPSTNDNATNKDYVDSLTVTPGTDSALDKVGTELFVVTTNNRIGINGSNQLELTDNQIRQNNLATDSVTTSKFFDGEVTNAKLASDTLTINSTSGITSVGGVALGGSATFNIDSTVLRTTGNQSASGIQNFTNTTNSTSFDTGGVVISGGLGIAGDFFSTGRIQTNDTIEAVTLGDGTMTSSSGTMNGLVNTNTGNLTATNTIQGGTVTDGTASLNSGSFVALINVTASGDITITAIPDERILYTDNGGEISGTSDLEWRPSVEIPASDELYTDLVTTQNITRVGNNPGQLWSNGTGDIIFGSEAIGTIQMGFGPMFKLTSTTSILQSSLTIQGNLSRQYVDTTINTAGNVTYTATQVFNGIIFRDCNGASRTDTLPTAQDLVNIVPEPIPGSSMEVLISNTSTDLSLLTLEANTTPGTGTVTLNESLTIASGITSRFLIVLNAISFGLWDVTVFSSVPKDRVIFQGSFRNAAQGGNSTLYCQWGPQTGNTGIVDSIVLGFSGKIIQLVCNYSHQDNIGIGANESLNFSLGLSDATLSVFTPFVGGTNIVEWTGSNGNNDVDGTKPQTSSGPVDFPVQATDRVAIQSQETGSVQPGSTEVRCSLTVTLD